MNEPGEDDSNLVICRCQTCSGHIQFDRAAFNSTEPPTVECPHCNLQTTLYIPETDTASPKPIGEPLVPPLLNPTLPQEPQLGFFKSEGFGTLLLMFSWALAIITGLVFLGSGLESWGAAFLCAFGAVGIIFGKKIRHNAVKHQTAYQNALKIRRYLDYIKSEEYLKACAKVIYLSTETLPIDISQVVGRNNSINNCLYQFIEHANNDKKMPHIMIYGENGVGKSATALLLAREMAIKSRGAFKVVNCEQIEREKKMEEVLANISKGEVMFFDNIENLDVLSSHFLIKVLADGTPFTLIATSDDLAAVSNELKMVFSVFEEFKRYSLEDITTISKQIVFKLGLQIRDEVNAIVVASTNGSTFTAAYIVNLVKTFINTRQIGNEITKPILDEAIKIFHTGREVEDEDRFDRKPIPPAVRREVWRRDERKCVQCGSQRNLELDHIIPVSKGGSNTARNIQLLCQDCNRTKSDKI